MTLLLILILLPCWLLRLGDAKFPEWTLPDYHDCTIDFKIYDRGQKIKTFVTQDMLYDYSPS